MDKPRRIWVNTLLFSLTFVAAVTLVPWYGFQYGFSSSDWLIAGLFLIFNGTAITAGYHRLWSHKAYEAHWSMRLWFAVWGAMATQNSIMHWTSGHRRHHTFVDDYDKDPYSASRGFWFSHIGWMLKEYDPKANDFSNIKDLKRDPIVVWQHRFYLPLVLATNIGFPLLAGLMTGNIVAALLLAGVLRLVLSHHFTFFINSLAHIWGKRPFTDKNTARDNGVLALLTWGEGYHNFHHIFQYDYRNGIRWWHYDPTKWIIYFGSKVGLTKGLRKVSHYRIEKARIDMQFKYASEKLTCQQALQTLEEQYQAISQTWHEWSNVRQKWMVLKKQELKQNWETSDIHTQYEELKSLLQEQQKQWQLARAGLLT